MNTLKKFVEVVDDQKENMRNKENDDDDGTEKMMKH